ncbi:MAG: coproporphyrinogen-III oxidase family protein [Armatimonadota bacterium]|jgi:oxygen-independent coproporphyrinogen-3 oxidase
MSAEDRGLSVYVHLPFCARKCHYCDFNSRPAPDAERARYLDALKLEIDRRGEILGGSNVRTVFFGGGTPTVYEGEELAGVLGSVAGPLPPAPALPCATNDIARAGRGGNRATAISPPPAPPLRSGEGEGTAPSVVRRKGFQPVGRPAEITCEANPETVDPTKLRALREAGFNRMSIGAQSFSDGELAMLGRGHCASQTEAAVEAARAAGFANVSLDLIYALPGQTVQSWCETLTRALALRPEHLSAYGLELAEGTVLFDRWARGEIEPVGESEHLAMRELTLELCERAGLRRYELSNYALPGRECAHNMTYWRNEPYLGLGAGAWSYLDGVRSENLREPAEYIEALEGGASPTAYRERLDLDDALMEALMMGLRMTAGLECAALERTFGPGRVEAMMVRARPLEEMGLVDLRGGRIRLTAAGEPLHSEVCVRLL